eukprot:TRINITY_DN18230_c0_g2_i1.p1 TRINITY_DN18230_c0_g2~~TRINITY_DN18230_c0_g2_i1.p1  ORF type:complete len:743 (+),score=226.62 TRINITY_DN18230_c0_g2_i1:104-2230(+)
MMMRAALSAFVLLAASMKIQQEEPMDPIQKVLIVLNTLKNQSLDEGVKEKAQFKKFFKFCNVTENEKIYQIDKREKLIAGLNAKIGVLISKINDLGVKLNETDNELLQINTSIENTNTDRDAEVNRYKAAAAEMEGAISSLDRAIKTLLSQKESLEGDVADLRLAQVSKAAGEVLKFAGRTSLLQMSVGQVQKLNQLRRKPGQPAGYTFKSGDVIALLKGLESTFKQNKMTLDMTESENEITYAKTSADLNSQKKFAKANFAELTLSRSEKSAELAETKTSHQDETAANNADKAFLAALQKDCKDKSDLSWRRLADRKEEQRLLDEAIQKTEAIPGGVPQKGAFLEEGTAQMPSFLQVEEAKHNGDSQPSKAVVDRLKQKAIDLLERERAKLGGGRFIALAQERVKAVQGNDPFVELRKVFKDLLAKLKDAADADQSKQENCSAQITEETENRDEAQIEIEKLNSHIDRLDAERNLTIKEENQLRREINQTTHELNEATELRAGEAAANKAAIKANKEAAQAVKDSLDFYAPGFLQLDSSSEQEPDMRAKDASGKRLKDYAPKVASQEYTGGKKVEGVIGILQKVYSDFTKAWMTIQEADDKGASDFEKYKKDAEDDLEGLENDVADKETHHKSLAVKIKKARDDKDSHTDLLTAALDMLEQLKVICDNNGLSYEKKRAKRQEEIDTLKDVTKLLDDMITEAETEAAR